MILGFARQMQIKTPYCGERERFTQRGVTEQARIPDFIWATAGTICKGSYNFGIYDLSVTIIEDCLIK